MKKYSARFSRAVILSGVCLVVGGAITALAQSPVYKPLTTKDKVAADGIGAVRIGMPLTKAIDTTQETWSVESSAAGSDCRYANPKKNALPLSFMVSKGVIARADVTKPGVATTTGIRVGDTEAKVKAAYPGAITVEKHKYNAAGHYLIYTPSGSSKTPFRIVFETDGKIVTRYRAGRLPEVMWVEGCF